MEIELDAPGPHELDDVLEALRRWQHDDAPSQLHPGDLGWFWRFGPERTAEALRTWRRDGRIVAVGLLDGPGLVRLTTAPPEREDPALAARLYADLTDPGRGVLGPGPVAVEAPGGTLVRERLAAAGWREGEPWTPLRRDLATPVDDPGVRVEVAGPEQAPERTAVHRAAFGRPTFTNERWHVMAAGPAYADARCLVARDDAGEAVAAVTVWSAGPGRPGLLEPMGVHPAHRGRGHGRAITLAAAAALRALGCSSAVVATPRSNVAGVATYLSAGFRARPESPDLSRPA